MLDHRLNSRTVYMNPVFRFLYWNISSTSSITSFRSFLITRCRSCTTRSNCSAQRPILVQSPLQEIMPTLAQQLRDQTSFVKRELTPNATPLPQGHLAPLQRTHNSLRTVEVSETSIDAGPADKLLPEDVAPLNTAANPTLFIARPRPDLCHGRIQRPRGCGAGRRLRFRE